jgi:hypothetical protein
MLRTLFLLALVGVSVFAILVRVVTLAVSFARRKVHRLLFRTASVARSETP